MPQSLLCLRRTGRTSAVCNTAAAAGRKILTGKVLCPLLLCLDGIVWSSFLSLSPMYREDDDRIGKGYFSLSPFFFLLLLHPSFGSRTRGIELPKLQPEGGRINGDGLSPLSSPPRDLSMWLTFGPHFCPLSHVLFRSNQSAIWEFIVVVVEEEGRLSIAKDPL